MYMKRVLIKDSLRESRGRSQSPALLLVCEAADGWNKTFPLFLEILLLVELLRLEVMVACAHRQMHMQTHPFQHSLSSVLIQPHLYSQHFTLSVFLPLVH